MMSDHVYGFSCTIGPHVLPIVDVLALPSVFVLIGQFPAQSHRLHSASTGFHRNDSSCEAARMLTVLG